MKAVPGWYRTLCGVLAVILSIWLGMHYRAPATWIAMYAAIALLTAALPTARIVGTIGLVVGVGTAACGGVLLKHVLPAMSLDDLLAFDGGGVSATRHALGFVLATTWLIGASAFRLARA